MLERQDGPPSLRAIEEQVHRRFLQGQGRHDDGVLAAHCEALSRRCQHAHFVARRQDGASQLPCARKDVLAIVEHQEGAAGPQVLDDGVDRIFVAGGNTEHVGDRGADGVAGGQGGQIDHPHAVVPRRARRRARTRPRVGSSPYPRGRRASPVGRAPPDPRAR